MRFEPRFSPDSHSYGLYYNQGALATGEGLYFNAPYFDFRLYALHLRKDSPVPPVTLPKCLNGLPRLSVNHWLVKRVTAS